MFGKDLKFDSVYGVPPKLTLEMNFEIRAKNRSRRRASHQSFDKLFVGKFQLFPCKKSSNNLSFVYDKLVPNDCTLTKNITAYLTQDRL